METGESLSDCLAREFYEELGIEVTWGNVLDVVHHHFYENIVVVIVGCHWVSSSEVRLSEEHSAVSWFDAGQLATLNIVPHYREVIVRWLAK